MQVGAADYIRENLILTDEERAIFARSSILQASNMFSACIQTQARPADYFSALPVDTAMPTEIRRPVPGEMRTEITLGYHYDNYTDEQLLKFGKAIVQMLELGEEVRVIRKRPGSVIINDRPPC